MKKIDFIYNPRSGDKKIITQLDSCIECFQNAGYDINIYRMSNEEKVISHIHSLSNALPDSIVVSGGDGTINLVVNEMMKLQMDLPLGIIPSGTANDFARHIQLPTDIIKCCEVICENNIKEIDLGKVNDRYFINVCAGGLFSNISQNIDTQLKNTLGKLAYYLKGIEQLPNFSPIHFKIETDKEVFEESCYLFLVLNGSSAGGFDMVSTASIEDGLLDFIGFKAGHIMDIAKTVLKLIRGELVNDEGVIHIKGEKFCISLLDGESLFKETDIDGESGPNMPVTISVVKKALKLFIPLQL